MSSFHDDPTKALKTFIAKHRTTGMQDAKNVQSVYPSINKLPYPVSVREKRLRDKVVEVYSKIMTRSFITIPVWIITTFTAQLFSIQGAAVVVLYIASVLISLLILELLARTEEQTMILFSWQESLWRFMSGYILIGATLFFCLIKKSNAPLTFLAVWVAVGLLLFIQFSIHVRLNTPQEKKN